MFFVLSFQDTLEASTVVKRWRDLKAENVTLSADERRILQLSSLRGPKRISIQPTPFQPPVDGKRARRTKNKAEDFSGVLSDAASPPSPTLDDG